MSWISYCVRHVLCDCSSKSWSSEADTVWHYLQFESGVLTSTGGWDYKNLRAHNTSHALPLTSPMRMQNIPNEFLYIYMKKNICEKCFFVEGTLFVVRCGHVRSFYSLQCNKNSIWKSCMCFVNHCFIWMYNYIFSFGFLSVLSMLFTFITWPCWGICAAYLGTIFRIYTSLYVIHMVPALFNLLATEFYI
jgi:hypothetical protein